MSYFSFLERHENWKAIQLIAVEPSSSILAINQISGPEAELALDTLEVWQSPGGSSIDWANVAQSIPVLLAKNCGDWRLIQLAGVTGQADQSVTTTLLPNALTAVGTLLEEPFWPQSHPLRHRTRFANQALVTLARWVSKDTHHVDSSVYELLQILESLALSRELTWPSEFGTIPDPNAKDLVDSSAHVPSATGVSNQTTAAIQIPGQTERKVSGSDSANSYFVRNGLAAGETDSAQRDRKRSLAEVYGHCRSSASLSLESLCLNRLTLWHDIFDLPPLDADNKCQLMPPGADTRSDYQSKLDLTDVDLLERWEALEKTLSTAPFWFDGQALAIKYAQRADQSAAAGMIAGMTMDVYRRLPGLENALFKDGTPMLSVDLASLTQAGLGAANEASPRDFLKLPEEISQMETSAQILVIERLLAQSANGTRYRALLLLHQARLYLDLGQNAAADALRFAAQQIFPSDQIMEWEPEFYALLHTRHS